MKEPPEEENPSENRSEQRRDNYLRSPPIFALQSTTKTLSMENEIQ